MPQIVASLTDNSVGIIYEHDMFIEQAAKVSTLTLFTAPQVNCLWARLEPITRWVLSLSGKF